MYFSVGDIVSADNEGYRVVGKITYRNTNDNRHWDEYRVISLENGREAWLSIDDAYKEYSISRVVRRPNSDGFHVVDRGREIVEDVYGDVDVERGDYADFTEYEDITEEKILSEERWDDGTEYSEGYYLDADEISFVRHDDSYVPRSSGSFGGGYSGGSGSRPDSKSSGIVAIVTILFVVIPMLGAILGNIHFTSTIAKFLKKDANYTYVTSITGNDKQKADVYKAPSGFTIDQTAKDIINAIEGDTQYVQQDSEEENGSVGILTKKEYCLVYTSEDGDVLVQVSNRKYAYTSDNDLYRGTHHSRRYYRRFYYSTGYTHDSSSYSGSSSPYTSYDDSRISYSDSDSYNSYSGTVRQDSINSRKSSGGGMSSGK
ncbi:MAG: DUF4178 domain-containing protein [Oscillospiraceae bacterium]|nr:DUF4178 domain-containing protein [Oscillospiraceae bacterium]